MTPAERESATQLIELLRRHRPDVVRLAMVASPAVRVEAPLLRCLRLELLPDLDAGVEADLWFSPLVQTTGRAGIELEATVANVLRRDLALDQDLLARSHGLIERFHATLTPALRLEEQVIWYSLIDDPLAAPLINEALSGAITAVKREGREGVARWAARALPELPEFVADTDAFWMLAWSSERLLGVPIRLEKQASPEQIRQLSDLADPPLRRTTVGVAREGGRLVVTRNPRPGGYALDVPDTTPIQLTVAWKRSRRRIDVSGQPLSLTTGTSAVRISAVDGTTYDLPADEKRKDTESPWHDTATSLLEAMTRNLGDIGWVPADSADIREQALGLADRWAGMLAAVAEKVADDRFVEGIAHLLRASGLLRAMFLTAPHRSLWEYQLDELTRQLVLAVGEAQPLPSSADEWLGAVRPMLDGMLTTAGAIQRNQLAEKGIRPPDPELFVRAAPTGLRQESIDMALRRRLSKEDQRLMKEVRRRRIGLGSHRDLKPYRSESLSDDIRFVPLSMTAFLDGFRHAVLIAPPGSGKTAAIRWIAHTLERRAAQEGGPQPVVVRCRDLFPEFGRRSLSGFLNAALDRAGYLVPHDSLDAMLAFGQLVVLVDGMDEVSPTQRNDIARLLMDLTSAFPLCPVLATTRSVEGVEPLSYDWFATATLLPLTDHEIEGLIEEKSTWVSEAGGPEAKSRVATEILLDVKNILPAGNRHPYPVQMTVDAIMVSRQFKAGSLFKPIKDLIDVIGSLSKAAGGDSGFSLEELRLDAVYSRLASSIDAPFQQIHLDDVVRAVRSTANMRLLSELVPDGGRLPANVWFSDRLVGNGDPFLKADSDLVTFRHELLWAYFATLSRMEALETSLDRFDRAAAQEIELAACLSKRLQDYSGQSPASVIRAAQAVAHRFSLNDVSPLLLLAARAHLAQERQRRRASAPAMIEVLLVWLSGRNDLSVYDMLNAILDDEFSSGTDSHVLPALFERYARHLVDDEETGLVADLLTGGGGLFHLQGFRSFARAVRRAWPTLPHPFRNLRERLETTTFGGPEFPLRDLPLETTLWREPIAEGKRLIDPLYDLAMIAAAAVSVPPKPASWASIPHAALAQELGRRLTTAAKPVPFRIPVALGTRFESGPAEVIAERLGLSTDDGQDAAVAKHLRMECVPPDALRGLTVALLMFAEVCDRERRALDANSHPDWPKRVDHEHLERHGRASFAKSSLFNLLAERFADLPGSEREHALNLLRGWVDGLISLTID